jgi:hypothetical protein
MKYLLFTIWDRVAEQAGPPFMAKNAGVARRKYQATLQNSNPVDYDLMHLGSYDDESMIIEPVVPNIVHEGREAASNGE